MKQNIYKKYKSKYVIFFILAFSCFALRSQYYFPPAQSSGVWDTVSPVQLNWCTSELDTLNQYLNQANTKGFVILYKGKIAVEWYYARFSLVLGISSKIFKIVLNWPIARRWPFKCQR